MFACICAATTEVEVRSCIRDGARCVESIGDACGAGTGCGSCHDRLQVLLMSTVAHDELEELPATA